MRRSEEDPSDERVGGSSSPAATTAFRFMHISPDDDKRISLLHGENPVTWRFVAKDGADLPPAHLLPSAIAIRAASFGTEAPESARTPARCR
jgi:hypothetical protein